MVRHCFIADIRNRRFIYATRVCVFIFRFIRPISLRAIFAGVSSALSNHLVPFNCVCAAKIFLLFRSHTTIFRSDLIIVVLVRTILFNRNHRKLSGINQNFCSKLLFSFACVIKLIVWMFFPLIFYRIRHIQNCANSHTIPSFTFHMWLIIIILRFRIIPNLRVNIKIVRRCRIIALHNCNL